MKRLKCLLAGIVALALTGCGQNVVETMNINTNPDMEAPGKGFTAVVLPFADYSNGDDTMGSAYRRSLRVTEAITDELVINGFGIPVQEDVYMYLVDQNIIRTAGGKSSAAHNSMQNELNNDWSYLMKQNLRHYINHQSSTSATSGTGAPGTHGLTKKAVAKLGREFGADYIIRGRIIEYKTTNDPTWCPMKKGVLPFVYGGANRMFYGFADSETYDSMNQIATGATLGAVGGQFTGWPAPSGSVISGTSLSGGAVAWGAAGGIMAGLANNGGKVDQAVVQLRMWVQEAVTGKVVWSNRIQVQVSPKTVFSDNRYDTLFDAAISKGVMTLMTDFVNTGL